MSTKLTWSEGRTDSIKFDSIKIFHNYSRYFWENIDKMALEENNWKIIGINQETEENFDTPSSQEANEVAFIASACLASG